MPKGGARNGTGPARERNALRRERGDDKNGWLLLPAAERTEPAPPWPLSRATKFELELWAREWRRPQATIWERNGQVVEVALMVRAVRISAEPTAKAADRNVARLQMDALGVTQQGMKALQWEIVSDELAQRRDTSGLVATEPRRPSARDRLKPVVDADAG